MKKISFYICLFFSLTILIIFITGSSLLTLALDDENSIPLGTFISWIGFIMYNLTFYYGFNGLNKPQNKIEKTLSITLKLFLIFSILWLPISYMLAGNISFNFTETTSFQGGQTAMRYFWIFCYILIIAPLLISSIHSILKLFKIV